MKRSGMSVLRCPDLHIVGCFRFVISVIFLAMVFSLFAWSFRVQAECVTGPDGNITCTGTDTDGVKAGTSGVTITVDNGASVTKTDQQTASEEAMTDAVTIETLNGQNTVTNSGTVAAAAEAIAAPAFMSPSQASAQALAVKTGADADIVTNASSIASGATSTAQALDVSLVFTLPNSAETTDATALAAGISGGAGNDTLKNTGAVTASADATARALNVKVQLTSVFGGDASIVSGTTVLGMEGGSGSDTITNEGQITATARSNTSVTGVSLSALQADYLSPVIKTNIETQATAAATGIAGGDGNDVITNSKSIASGANASVAATAVSLTLEELSTGNASSTATAAASGIEGGAGSDRIANSGDIGVAAEAEVDTWSVTLKNATTRSDPLEWLGMDLGGEAQTTAEASAVGVTGNEGDDEIDNSGSITVNANANADSNSIALEVSIPLKSEDPKKKAGLNQAGNGSAPRSMTGAGMAIAAAEDQDIDSGTTTLMDAGTNAQAQAQGITAGDGNDRIENKGKVSVKANAAADSLSVAATLSHGRSESADLLSEFGISDTSTKARAFASGLEGGAGDDVIDNSADIDVEAAADAASTIVAARVQTDSTDEGAEDKGKAKGGILPEFEIGAALVKSETTTSAAAVGMDGGAGNDTISNSGRITVKAKPDAVSASAAATLVGARSGYTVGMSYADVGTNSNAQATGIQGGVGNDNIINTGEVDVTAQADSLGVSVGLTVAGNVAKTGDDKPGQSATAAAAVTKGNTAAVADAIGISGGADDNILYNSGKVRTNAIADAATTAVSASVSADNSGSNKGLALGFTYADISTKAQTTAGGIKGGTGIDHIANDGELAVVSTALADSVSVAATISGTMKKGLGAAGAAVADGTTEATASAAGLEGGANDDMIVNSGKSGVTATADADSVSVAVTISAAKDTGLVAGASLADATTTAIADVVGMDGGTGQDYILNQGESTINATALADSVSVAATISGVMKAGIAGGAALADATTEADASATGLEGGANDDMIVNTGKNRVNATADAGSTSVAVDLGFAGGETGLAGGASFADATTTAKTGATGMDGGSGKDKLLNLGETTVASTATAHSASVAFTAVGVKGTGAALGLSLVDGSTQAMSGVTGMSGDAGEDEIGNAGSLNVTSQADATSASVAVTVSVAKEGVALGGSLAKGTTTSQATALGMDGGTGIDRISNAGLLNVTANSESSSASVSVTAAGTMTGAAAGVALADATTTASSAAAGITGGEGNDQVVNSGTLTTSSSADSASASVAVNLGFTKTGLTAGVAAADATITTAAAASGINGGAGDDRLYNSGTLITTAKAEIDAASVAVQGGLAVSGAAIGAALTDGETVATAAAYGLQGGAGNDILENTGTNMVSATADVTGASVGVSLEATTSGIAAGASIVDGTNRAEARATGLGGDAGEDTITNRNTTQVTAVTDSVRADVSVSGSVALEGVAAGASFANASNTALSEAVGMDGGADRDTLINEAALTANSDTTATTTSISVEASISGSFVSLGASLADAETFGTAKSTGMTGGAGDDQIENRSAGVINGAATVDAEANSGAVSISIVSYASAKATTTAEADFIGMSGGSGQDNLINQGSIDIKAGSESAGHAVTINLAGYGSADMSVKSTARTAGLAGGDDNDSIENYSSIITTSGTTTTGVSISAGLSGAGFAKGQATAESFAAGLSGGAGNDSVYNNGSVKATAHSDADMTSLSLKLAGFSKADGTTLSGANITGLDGGSGDDVLINDVEGKIEATARAKAETVGVSVGLLGVADTKASSTTTANAFGLAGGSGKDTLLNRQTVKVDALSYNTGKSGSGNLLGEGAADVSASSLAAATGLEGGDDDDGVQNEKTINASSYAYSKVLAVTGQVGGAGFADTKTTSWASTTGLSGGSGNDTVFNKGGITLTANSDTDMTGVAVNLVGFVDANGSTLSGTTVTGLDGGSGDDILINDTNGSIDATATAKTETVSVGVNLAGVAKADGSSTTSANAYGLAGGGGNDTLVNRKKVDIKAFSENKGTAGSGTLAGEGSADVSLNSLAVAIGMDGGDDDDIIDNQNSIIASSGTTAVGLSVEVSLAGAGSAETRTTAWSNTTGLSGGAGNDTVNNSGSIQAKAESNTDMTGVSVKLFGSSNSDGSSLSRATATGLEGGSGDDVLINDFNGEIGVTAYAKAETTAVSVNLAGAVSADGSSTTAANASGMAGGSGNDILINRKDVIILAVSENIGTSVSGTLAGKGSADVGLNSSVISTGMAGGDNDDIIDNENKIEATSIAGSRGLSVSVGLVGVNSANSKTSAESCTTGLSGGAGNDRVNNSGSILLTAVSNTDMANISVNLAGATDSDGSSLSGATVIGMEGGEGNNYITNFSAGSIILNAAATGTAGSYTAKLVGGGSAKADTEAVAAAYGMQAGSGSDILINQSAMDISSGATLTASVRSLTFIGASSGEANSTASSAACGMDGGDGANTIINDAGAVLKLKANASAFSSDNAKIFAGAINADADSTAASSATGLKGGAAEDVIVNKGDLDVSAYTLATASTDARIFAGRPTAISASDATATVTEVDAGEGKNFIANDKIIKGNAIAEADSFAYADSSFASTFSKADSNSTATASGIKAGADDDNIINGQNGKIEVYSQAKGGAGTISDEFSYATAIFMSNATGIGSGDGNNVIATNGQITTESVVNVNSHAIGSSAEGHAEAKSASYGEAIAAGIEAGNGNNRIYNNGVFTVKATNTASALSDYIYEHLDLAESTADIEGNAVGISVGDGVNLIESDSSITVTSTVNSRAESYSNTVSWDNTSKAYAFGRAGAVGISAGNSQNTVNIGGTMTVFALAEANARGYGEDYGTAVSDSHANAIGIRLGNGNNIVTNQGAIDVQATAIATAIATGEDDNPIMAVTVGTEAIGIQTGSGNDRIFIGSQGPFNLSAVSSGSYILGNSNSVATAIDAGDGANDVENHGVINVISSATKAWVGTSVSEAVGIRTGSGDDKVSNYGTVYTAQNTLTYSLFEGYYTVSTPGIAIMTGAGNDTVTLGSGSTTIGAIDLGTGDDTLAFLGTAKVDGNIDSSQGSDSLIFDGAGTLDCNFSGFENTTKQGAGTFTLTAALPTMKRLEINQGTLQLNSSYTMAGDSAFHTVVNHDGSHGQLSVNGTVSLNGSLTVNKDSGLYVNGTTYDIITAGLVSSDFTSVTLPEATPLLSFTKQNTADAVQIEAEVKSYTTVAANETERAVAEYLDRIAAGASDDLKNMLGQVQSLQASQFESAFMSLNPGSYHSFTMASFSGLKGYTESLERRMEDVRFTSALNEYGTEPRPILLALGGADENLDELFRTGKLVQARAQGGLWLDGFGQWNDREGEPGYTGFDYDVRGTTVGFDSTFTDHLTAGCSFAYARTDIDLDQSRGEGEIESLTSAIYGSYFTKNGYVQGVVSYGENEYTNYRTITLGPIQRIAQSEHRGDAFSSYLGGGYFFDAGKQWTFGPFASLLYSSLDEEGFRETGADSLNLIVERRKTDSLVSELGLRLAGMYKTENGRFIPEIHSFFNYDFDIDDRTITASFTGSPDAKFSMSGQEVEKYGFKAGIGFTYLYKKNFSSSLKYTGQFRDGNDNHGVMAQIKFLF